MMKLIEIKKLKKNKFCFNYKNLKKIFKIKIF